MKREFPFDLAMKALEVTWSSLPPATADTRSTFLDFLLVLKLKFSNPFIFATWSLNTSNFISCCSRVHDIISIKVLKNKLDDFQDLNEAGICHFKGKLVPAILTLRLELSPPFTV